MDEYEDGGSMRLEDVLPSPDAGPEALYLRQMLLDALEWAIEDLPKGAMIQRKAKRSRYNATPC